MQLISKLFKRQLASNSSEYNFYTSDFGKYGLGQARMNCQSILNSLCNLNKLIFTKLNINSIRNTFDYLPEQVKGKIDILLVAETKTDNSFPIG